MWAALLPVAYLLGAFPSAVLVARAAGVDITASGSGNPGASNVTRTLGWRKGVLVFALDAAKGALATLLGLWAGGWGGGDGSWDDARRAGYALGAAAVVGHVAPITRRFRGGKGVATGAGVLIVLHPAVAVGAAVAWGALFNRFAKASVASIAAVALVPVGLAITGAPAWEYAATLVLSAIVVARHVGNVRRLLSGQEQALTRQSE